MESGRNHSPACWLPFCRLAGPCFEPAKQILCSDAGDVKLPYGHPVYLGLGFSVFCSMILFEVGMHASDLHQLLVCLHGLNAAALELTARSAVRTHERWQHACLHAGT
jgi:hypothetical protein